MQDKLWFGHIERKTPKRLILARMEGTGKLDMDGWSKEKSKTNEWMGLTNVPWWIRKNCFRSQGPLWPVELMISN